MSIVRAFFEQVCSKLFLVLFLWTISSCSRYQKVDYEIYQQRVVPTTIVNVNVLSEDGESMLPNRNVYFENGKIVFISQDDVIPENSREIDGSGKYLIPGLIDSHVHLQDSPNDLLVFPAHGVTYVREMSGNEEHLKWRDEVAKGRIGPKMLIVSEKVGSKSGLGGLINSLFWTRINVSTQSQANELIAQLIADGYQGVKISSDINKAMYLAVTKAARKEGLAIVGHIPYTIGFDDFLSSQHKELAHIEELTKTLDNEFGGFYSKTADEFLQFVKSRSDDVAINVKQNGISVGTTLWYMETLSKQAVELEHIIQSLDLTYGNPNRVAHWMPGENKFEASETQKNDPETMKKIKIYWETYVKAIHIMLEALIKHDVILLAGTDSMTSLVIPGVSLHDELESLVNRGLSPAQALRSATIVPSQWMASNTGKVAIGYDADLVLLNKNPLQNIKNTKEIETVILNGKVLDKQTIDNILNSVKTAYGHVLPNS